MQKSHEILRKKAEESFLSDPILRGWLAKVPLPEWPRQNYMSQSEGEAESLKIYFALIRAIISQQISTKAAKAVLQKLIEMGDGDLPKPEMILKADKEHLRACGLSPQKIRYLKEVAKQTVQKNLPLPQEALAMDSSALRQRLTNIHGVGAWSADMVMIFALQHPDIFAVGDYGVREGYRLIFGHEKQLSPKILANAGEVFSPYRSWLTFYCWAVKEFSEK